jgi:lipid II:glycine glycyltransferase (peptidoglycan interpeptide bridge formation enzyme)
MSVRELTSSADIQAYQVFFQNSSQSSLWQSIEFQHYQESLGRQTRLFGHFGASQNAAPRCNSHVSSLKENTDAGEAISLRRHCESIQSTSDDTFIAKPYQKLTATALVLIDRTAMGLSVWDIPRGPLGDDQGACEELLGHIKSEAEKDRCMALYCSPFEDIRCKTKDISNSNNHLCLISSVFHPSSRHQQPEATLIIDLTLKDDELLSQMKQKGRYNINVARKRGVVVQESKDVDVFYQLLRKTSARDQFGILPKTHYEHFLHDLPGSFLLLASLDEEPISGLLGVIHNHQGAYYYGASSYAHRAAMAPYLLQWEAMMLCRSRGALQYDLLGIAPDDDPKHPWAGVSRFKKQFGGSVINYSPERELVLRPLSKLVIGLKRKILG